MELTIHDRLILLQAIPLGSPQSGDLLSMRVAHDLVVAVGITEEEQVAHKFTRLEDGSVTWVEGVRDIEIGPLSLDIVRKGLSAALPIWNRAKQLTLGHLLLCDKFGVSLDIETPEEDKPEAE